MDSSMHSLKAVLLHKGQILSSIPVAYAVHKRETWKHEEISRLHELQDTSMAFSQWFEGNCHSRGLQQGYKKFCFLRERDCRVKIVYEAKKNWPLRKSLTPGAKNVVYQHLADLFQVLLQPLRFKLGLTKNFVKALDRNCLVFSFMCV